MGIKWRSNLIVSQIIFFYLQGNKAATAAVVPILSQKCSIGQALHKKERPTLLSAVIHFSASTGLVLSNKARIEASTRMKETMGQAFEQHRWNGTSTCPVASFILVCAFVCTIIWDGASTHPNVSSVILQPTYLCSQGCDSCTKCIKLVELGPHYARISQLVTKDSCQHIVLCPLNPVTKRNQDKIRALKFDIFPPDAKLMSFWYLNLSIARLFRQQHTLLSEDKAGVGIFSPPLCRSFAFCRTVFIAVL